MRVLWLPDAFGYSYALPQVARQSGIRYFVTSKLSWSQFNRFPYDTFRLARARRHGAAVALHHHARDREPGRRRAHLQRADHAPRAAGHLGELPAEGHQRRAADAVRLGRRRRRPDAGNARPGRGAQQPARHPDGRVGEGRALSSTGWPSGLRGEDVPVWDGELYLEIHRGHVHVAGVPQAGQPQGRNPLSRCGVAEQPGRCAAGRTQLPRWTRCARAGRRFCSTSSTTSCPARPSGRSTKTRRPRTSASRRSAAQALTAALDRIAAGVRDGQGKPCSSSTRLSWDARRRLLALPWDAGRPPDDRLAGRRAARAVPVVHEDGETARCWSRSRAFPRWATAPTRWSPPPSRAATRPPARRVEAMPAEIDGHARPPRKCFLAHRAQCGRARSARCTTRWRGARCLRRSRPANAASRTSRGNVFQAFEDKPMNFDAWDIDIYYQEKMAEINGLDEAVVEESGPGARRAPPRLALRRTRPSRSG